MQKKIYLAGAALSGWAEQYREKAIKLLPEFECINPFRGKLEFDNDKYNPNLIVVRDMNDIKECDIVLAELILDNHSYIGTSMEIFYAGKILNKPVIVWTNKDYHYWLQHCAVGLFSELEDCTNYIRQYFL